MAKNGINNKGQNNVKNGNSINRKSDSIKNTPNEIYSEDKKLNYLHLPIYIIISILPLIVLLKVYDPNMAQFTWFSNQTIYQDFFLYYKQNLLIIISAMMLFIAIYKTYKERKTISVLPIFIPLGAYALLCILSTVLSKYSYFSYRGSLDQFESVFALLGYCIIVYYVYLHLKTEREVQVIIQVLILGALLISIIGVSQFVGHDFFTSELGYKLITPVEYRTDAGIVANFGSERVYMTLFNPNYVGVYVALVTPVILVMLFFQKKIIWIVLSILSVIGLLISEIGSQSIAGFIGFGAAVILIFILLRHYIFRKPIIPVSIISFLIIGFILMNIVTDNFLLNKVKTSFQYTKTEHALSDMETLDDGVSLTYNGKKIKVMYVMNESNILSFQVVDKDNNSIATNFDPSANIYRLADNELSDITLGIDMTQAGVFIIQAEGYQYRFTNFTEDGSYYYLNQFNRLDKLKTAPSSLFQGYESFASGRGYIWSRTIPLIKKYIILGSGPDTFTMVFPQNDYVGANYNGYSGQIMTKPHSLYLQIAVQTGLLSLIAFLTFYGMYFVASLRLYFKGQFESYYSKVGVAIFIGTVAYMVTGITNDSTITVAPVFWTLIGVGIAINYKVTNLRKKEKALK